MSGPLRLWIAAEQIDFWDMSAESKMPIAEAMSSMVGLAQADSSLVSDDTDNRQAPSLVAQYGQRQSYRNNYAR